jgi:hypothetical protein
MGLFKNHSLRLNLTFSKKQNPHPAESKYSPHGVIVMQNNTQSNGISYRIENHAVYTIIGICGQDNKGDDCVLTEPYWYVTAKRTSDGKICVAFNCGNHEKSYITYPNGKRLMQEIIAILEQQNNVILEECGYLKPE